MDIRPREDATPEEKAAAVAACGIKYDGGKPRISLLPPCLLDLAQTLTDAYDRSHGPEQIKPRVDLIPIEAIIELGQLYAIGAKKYSPDNWRRGYAWSRSYDAMMRHMLKFWERGERIDEDTGIHHLIAVIWNAIAIYYYDIKEMTEFDDRPE